MKLTKTSSITGIEHTMDLDITPEQIERYNNGELIQRAFPNLSAGEREFIMTGITPKEWDDIFSPEK
jgi:hypothetical protein